MAANSIEYAVILRIYMNHSPPSHHYSEDNHDHRKHICGVTPTRMIQSVSRSPLDRRVPVDNPFFFYKFFSQKYYGKGPFA